MNIALITYQDQQKYLSPTQENEDDTLLNFLQEKGLSIKKVIWNNPEVNWEQYDLAILKSPWDYFDHVNDFYQWIDQLSKCGVRLLNPPEIVKWNADKHYLKDIDAQQLAVTPSAFLNQTSSPDLRMYFEKWQTDRLIIKPCISGGANHTYQLKKEALHLWENQLSELLKSGDFIVQPFLNEVTEQGEWSFIFFGNEWSHCVLKKAKEGDFRVQHSFGGTIHPQQPSQELIAAAQKYLEAFATDCLYARVDGTLINGEFVLMELELIEPFLFLHTTPESLENYYQALKKWL